MDIVNELKIIESNENNKKKLLQNMTDDLDKKLHIFKVIEFAYAIDSLLENPKCNKYLSSVKFFNNQYPYRSLMITVLDNKEHNILRDSINLMEELQDLVVLIENIRDSKIEYTKCDMPLNISIKVELKKGAGEEIIKHLLSDDLLSILKYSQMQIDLEPKILNEIKKPKL
jgi:UDP-N-acetylglucosamine 2-epimerase